MLQDLYGDLQNRLEQAAGEVYNLIRGLSPFPGAFTYPGWKLLKSSARKRNEKPCTDVRNQRPRRKHSR